MQLLIHAALEIRSTHRVLPWTSLHALITNDVVSPEPASLLPGPASLLPAWAAVLICILCFDGLPLAAVLGRAGLLDGVGAKPLPT